MTTSSNTCISPAWQFSARVHTAASVIVTPSPPLFCPSLPTDLLIFVYCCVVWCGVVWCGAGNGLFSKLEIVHRRSLRAILRLPPETKITVLYGKCRTFPLKHDIDRSSCIIHSHGQTYHCPAACTAFHMAKPITAPQHVQHSLKGNCHQHFSLSYLVVPWLLITNDGVIRFSLRWLEVRGNLKRTCPKLSPSTE